MRITLEDSKRRDLYRSSGPNIVWEGDPLAPDTTDSGETDYPDHGGVDPRGNEPVYEPVYQPAPVEEPAYEYPDHGAYDEDRANASPELAPMYSEPGVLNREPATRTIASDSELHPERARTVPATSEDILPGMSYYGPDGGDHPEGPPLFDRNTALVGDLEGAMNAVPPSGMVVSAAKVPAGVLGTAAKVAVEAAGGNVEGLGRAAVEAGARAGSAVLNKVERDALDVADAITGRPMQLAPAYADAGGAAVRAGERGAEPAERAVMRMDDAASEGAAGSVDEGIADIRRRMAGEAPTAREAATASTDGATTTAPPELDDAIAGIRDRLRQQSGKPPGKARVEPPDLPQGKKERGFAKTARTSDDIAPEVRADLADNPITYNPITNEATRAEAESLIARDAGAARALVYQLNEPLDAQTSTVAQLLIKRAQDAGDYADAVDLVERLAVRATKAGQGIQALNMFSALSPEGVGRYIQRVIDKAAERRPGLKQKLTPDMLGKFVDRAEAVAALPEGRDKLLQQAILVRDIHELVPPTLLERLSTLQTMAQLLNPKTAVRNIFGNAAFAGFEQLSRAVAVGVDMPLSKLTGERSITGPNLGAQVRGAVKGAREGAQEAAHGVTLPQMGTQFDLGNGATRTFRSGPFAKLEQAMNFELRVPDRAFYQAAVEESLLSQASVKAMNEGLRGQARDARALQLLAEPTKDMMAVAHQDGLYRTFQDDTVLARAFSGLKKAMNLQQQWGFGDLVLKYPRTPANLLMRALDYSSAGFVNAAFDVARALSPIAGKPFNQKAFVEKVGRATVGTAGFTFLGFAMTDAGVLSGRANKDKDARAVEATEGLGPYRLNTSGLLRWVASGFTQKQKLQAGDNLISYDWAAPLSVSLAVGSAISTKAQEQSLREGKKKAPESTWDALSKSFLGEMLGPGVDSLAAAVDTIAAQPMIQGVQRVFGGRDPGETFVQILKDAPSSFVPTLVSQVNQVFNNKTRETYSPDAVQEALNGVIAKVPILANSLPDRVNVWGEPQSRYHADTNNPFNVFVNPAFVTQYIPKPEADMLLELQRATGEVSEMPRLVSKTITADGVTYRLSPKEYTDYQQVLGQKTREAFGNLAGSQAFQTADPEKKVEYLSNILTDLNRLSKEELRKRALAVGGDLSPAFQSLDPLKSGRGETVTEKNAADNFRDKQYLDRYDHVDDEVDAKIPYFQTAKEYHDTLSGAELKRFEASSRWQARQARIRQEREKVRNDPKVKAALKRWRGEG